MTCEFAAAIRDCVFATTFAEVSRSVTANYVACHNARQCALLLLLRSGVCAACFCRRSTTRACLPLCCSTSARSETDLPGYARRMECNALREELGVAFIDLGAFEDACGNAGKVLSAEVVKCVFMAITEEPAEQWRNLLLNQSGQVLKTDASAGVPAVHNINWMQ